MSNLATTVGAAATWRTSVTKLNFILGFLVTIALVSCGGDDDDPGGDDATGEPQATQSTGQPDGQGTNEPGTGGNDDFHACSLFTGAEMTEILGAQVADGRDYLATAADATNCVWEGDVVIYIEVLLEDGESWYDAIHLPDAGGDVEEVDGIGDKALWDEFLGTLDVVDGDRFISVQPIVGFSDLDAKEVALEVAPLALERLP